MCQSIHCIPDVFLRVDEPQAFDKLRVVPLPWDHHYTGIIADRDSPMLALDVFLLDRGFQAALR